MVARGLTCIQPILPGRTVDMREPRSEQTLAELSANFQARHHNNEQLCIIFLVDEKEIMGKPAYKGKNLSLEEAMEHAVQQHIAAVQNYTNSSERPPYIYVVATPATYKLAVELFFRMDRGAIITVASKLYS